MRLTRHLKDSLSLRLAFRSLTSPHTVTRWLILQKARRHGEVPLRLLVGARFQVLFHSPLGVLFTFPSRYWSTIGHTRVFSLGEWSPQIHTGFLVSGITQVTDAQGCVGFRLRGFNPVPPAFPGRLAIRILCDCVQGLWPLQDLSLQHLLQQRPKAYTCMGLGSVRFRSPLLAQSRLISFPPGT